MCIMKNIVRVGVIGGLLVGTAVVIAGPSRVHAIVGQARGYVNHTIDNAIQDPVALRQQLRELETQFPKKIAEVRSELSELVSQMSSLKKDRDIAAKVVELASADHEALGDLIHLAQEARMDSPGAIIRVNFENRPIALDQAYTKAAELSSTISAYRGRLVSAEDTLGFLQTQEHRLEGLLAELEEKYGGTDRAPKDPTEP